MSKSFYRIILAFIILTSITVSSNFAFSAKIENIVVNGNYRIESDTIVSNLGLELGEDFTKELKPILLRRLYNTGFFKNVVIEFKNGKLIVNVEEATLIDKVSFVGNKKLSSETLEKEASLKAGDVLSDAKLQIDTLKIQELYKSHGYFLAKVHPRIETLEDGRVVVIFDIMEGSKTHIQKIVFIGNKTYTNSALKSIILTKEKAWFRFLDPNTAYDADRISYDKELIKRFYQSAGFADIAVLSATAELSREQGYFTVTYVLDEGMQYDIGKINIKTDIKQIDTEQLYTDVDIKPGSIFNIQEIEHSIEKITDSLIKTGFYQIEVSHDVVLDKENRFASIDFTIDRASKAYLQDINITGNVKTADHVIRREIPMAEGDFFDRDNLQKADKNLKSLNFFKTVHLSPIPTDNGDTYDLLVNVEDKSTAQIGASLGYNTVNSIYGELSFRENNFLGLGKELDVGVHRTKRFTNYHFSLEDPYFLGKDLGAGITLFKDYKYRDKDKNKEQGSTDPYSTSSYGMGLSLAYSISEHLKHNINYSLSFVDLKVATQLMNQDANLVYSTIGHTISHDKLDNPAVPKNGYRLALTQEFSGLGGNVKFIKHDLRSKFYKSFANNNLTLRLSAGIGDITGLGGQRIRINDRFKLGADSLRGFDYSGVGPRDMQGNSLGGKNYYNASAELVFPVGLPKEFEVTGSVFSDLGTVWNIDTPGPDLPCYQDKALRASVGVGFTWVTAFVPIRVDYAIPVKRKFYDQKRRVLIRFSANL